MDHSIDNFEIRNWFGVDEQKSKSINERLKNNPSKMTESDTEEPAS